MVTRSQNLEGMVTWLYCYLAVIATLLLVDMSLPLCSNARLRYYACYTCYIATFSIFAPLFIPLLPLMLVGNLNIYYIALPARIMTFFLGIKWEVRGLENLDKNRPAVVAATHQSMFDILGLFCLGSSLRSVVAVARKAVFYILPLGPLFWLSGGVVFINNQKKGSSYTWKTLSNISKTAKKKKMKIIFFPEGTRNLNGKTLLPFKKGAFRLAIETQLPIIPTVFSPYNLIDPQKKTFHKGRVIISILPPIETEGTSMSDLEVIKEKTQQIMETEFQKLRSEVETDFVNRNSTSDEKNGTEMPPKDELPNDTLSQVITTEPVSENYI